MHFQLRLILERMRREFSWLQYMRYEMCICCPACSQKGSVKCRSHDVRGCECLHLLSEFELVKCQYCTRPGFREDCRIRIKMFAPWFSFSDPNESRTLVNEVCFYLSPNTMYICVQFVLLEYHCNYWSNLFTILDIRKESIRYFRLGRRHISCLRDLSLPKHKTTATIESQI